MNESKWSEETMRMVNELTPDIKGKAFNPGWFMLRQRLEQVDGLVKIDDLIRISLIGIRANLVAYEFLPERKSLIQASIELAEHVLKEIGEE